MLNVDQEKKLFGWLEENGILIGSRKWGGFTPESDYDFVFGVEKIHNFLTRCQKELDIRSMNGSSDNLKHTMYNILNTKFMLDGKKINLLIYADEDVHRLNILNSMVDLLPNYSREKMNNLKRYRIQVIENFLCILFEEFMNPTQISHNLDDDIPF